jgi:hypothetical protein
LLLRAERLYVAESTLGSSDTSSIVCHFQLIHRSAQKWNSAKFAIAEFSEVRMPRSCAANTHGDALWALLERALRREATGAAGSGTFREQMLTSRQMPCRQVEAAGRGVVKRSLTGRRRAPGAPAPQEDDPGRCEAQLDPLGAVPAFLPAPIAADLWVEPDAGPRGL